MKLNRNPNGCIVASATKRDVKELYSIAIDSLLAARSVLSFLGDTDKAAECNRLALLVLKDENDFFDEHFPVRSVRSSSRDSSLFLSDEIDISF
ncbi:hypothetical protein [Microvirus mar55]|uniref:Uncharacterized protein n=1 Tax=Microvirus mar55 TaxID=2851191 RepID=A0A8F5RC41_9VIRU|nr:hypothetical protein [Microvirus mar55]